MKNLGTTSKGVISLALLTFFSNLPTNGGEDVANARNNAFSDYPIDFWGGVSSFFYSRIPDFPLGWAVHLLLFQVVLIAISLILFIEKQKTRSKKFKIFFLIFAYFALVFGSHETRDGLMFSLVSLALSIMYSRSSIRSSRLRVVTSFLGTSTLIFAFSFRPWVSLSCSLLMAGWFFLGNRTRGNAYKVIVSILIFVMLPVASLAVEFAARDVIGIHTIHPEQQVISMDLGAAYCWSTNPRTVTAARDALSLMYLDRNPENVCESFKPINWAWFSRKPIIENSSSPTSFTFLTEKNETEFKSLRDKWLRVILNDPSSYIQNKYMFASQVFIAGDSRYIRLLNQGYYASSPRMHVLDIFAGIFYLPWDLVISLHLLSMQIVMVFWLFLVIRQYRGGYSRNFRQDYLYLISFFLWLTTTVVAYIGDNGRYTYSASLALLFTLFLINGEGHQRGKIETSR
jgi:hypothetical protein